MAFAGFLFHTRASGASARARPAQRVLLESRAERKERWIGTGQRAEIKGRQGDEFVKKAEAGQQHASRTSKGQDEMKSNRCPSPPRLETLFSLLSCYLSHSVSPPFNHLGRTHPLRPLTFLYPLSFLSPDFLPRCLRHFFSSSLPFLQSSVLHIRFDPPRSVFLFLPFIFSLSPSFLVFFPGTLAGARGKSKPEENTGDKGGRNRWERAREPFTRRGSSVLLFLPQFPRRSGPLLAGVKRNF